MTLLNRLWNAFSRAVAWGIKACPRLTVWLAEEAFYLAPRTLRRWVDRYASERILACVVGGELPFLPELNGGDAVLFYPLPQCERYELEGHTNAAFVPLFGGAIQAAVVPQGKRQGRYQVLGYDSTGTRYDSGWLRSHTPKRPTQVTNRRLRVGPNAIRWTPHTPRYLTSFVIVIDAQGVPHAAGYRRRGFWAFPSVKYLAHVVLSPDGFALDQQGAAVMVMVVETDAWVPEILMWP